MTRPTWPKCGRTFTGRKGINWMDELSIARRLAELGYSMNRTICLIRFACWRKRCPFLKGKRTRNRRIKWRWVYKNGQRCRLYLESDVLEIIAALRLDRDPNRISRKALFRLFRRHGHALGRNTPRMWKRGCIHLNGKPFRSEQVPDRVSGHREFFDRPQTMDILKALRRKPGWLETADGTCLTAHATKKEFGWDTAQLERWEINCPRLPEGGLTPVMCRLPRSNKALSKTYPLVKLQTIKAASQPKKFDGVYQTPKGRAFNLARASLESGIPVKTLNTYIRPDRCPHLPESVLPSHKATPPSEHGRSKDENVVLESDLIRLRRALARPITERSDTPPVGYAKWHEIQTTMGVRSFAEGLRLATALARLRDECVVAAVKVKQTAGNHRHSVLFYHKETALTALEVVRELPVYGPSTLPPDFRHSGRLLTSAVAHELGLPDALQQIFGCRFLPGQRGVRACLYHRGTVTFLFDRSDVNQAALGVVYAKPEDLSMRAQVEKDFGKKDPALFGEGEARSQGSGEEGRRDATSNAIPTQNQRHPTKRRRRAADRKPTPLTPTQVEAMQLVGEYKGNISAAARAAGKSHTAMRKLYEKACKKLGRKAVEQTTQRIPRDRRGQETVTEDRR